ncbi:hypothetical protein HSX11_08385 [Oxalobacteraceae bacterium]|nr:hypothetical protein [Oxalobacteraceae bacterium]
MALALALTIMLTACATTGNGKAKTLTGEEAARILVIGKTSKADVSAALGEAHITRFDSGYELWLYGVGVPRMVDSLPWFNLVLSSADNQRELTVLFDKSGIVRKYQMREK